MASHYADYPGVVGWQNDNELNAEGDTFYSDADDASFRVWF
ncbi:beta-galactosidase [Paenibacillus cellulosilyticus]|nr:beta-galactosidase [Paenibacillus cellulosilyticus]